MNTDRIVGTAKELGGKAQAVAGQMLDNGSTELEGRYRQAEGVAQDAVGQAKRVARDVAEDAGEIAHDAYKRGDRVVRGASRLIEKRVDEAPVGSLAVVALVAFALGYALRSATAE